MGQPDPYDDPRRTRTLWLGLALLLGFLAPILIIRGWPQGPALRFPTFELVNADGASAAHIFFALYPALAGVGIILLAVVAGRAGRAAGVALLGLLPLAILGLDSQTVTQLEAAVDRGGGLALLALISYVGWAGAWVAGRTVRAAPRGVAGPALGALAGAACLLTLGLPLSGAAWPGSAPAVLPIRLITGPNTFMLGVWLLAQTLCLAGAAVACIGGFALQRSRPDLVRGRWAVGFALATLLAFTLCVFSRVYPLIPAYQRGGPALTGLSVLVKVVLAVALPLLLLPLGLADLIVRLTGPGVLPAGHLDIRKRLKALRQLRRHGIIDEAEYIARRADLEHRLHLH